MSSGVKPSEACIKTFEELKLGKKLKFVIFSLTSDLKSIDVLTKSTDDDYEKFVAELPEKECRWAVYDIEFEKPGEGKRNKICFISWTPDDASIKQRMISASSKDALRKQLVGIATDIQATSYDEITKEAVLDKCQRR